MTGVPGDKLGIIVNSHKKRKEIKVTDEQIKYMVDRFLEWRLPENFNPDAGISFKPDFNEHTAHPMKHEPIGTNLFDAVQAEEMVRYLIDGLPSDLSERTARFPRRFPNRDNDDDPADGDNSR
jgi:hypothetical protein